MSEKQQTPEQLEAEEKLDTAVIRCVGQITVSLVALGVGLWLTIAVPDLREWGTGMIGVVVGYWLK